MIDVLLGLAVGGVALALAFAVVWARWAFRDQRKRLDRTRARLLQRDDVERARRRLRLRVEPRSDGGGPPLSPRSVAVPTELPQGVNRG